jgi:uncharacterized protein YndB with AHSA1/START domain
MARNTTEFPVPPEQVWAVLADPDAYAHWVVGSKYIRDADPSWPAEGAKFHHTVGIGPLTIKDNTQVLESRAPERLVLRARARPSGTANVVMQLEPHESGTRVVMEEFPVSGLAKIIHNPLQDKLIYHRNVESLRRLRHLAETRAAGA